MAYIFQMRSGIRHVNAGGETLKNEDGTPAKEDWSAYAQQIRQT